MNENSFIEKSFRFFFAMFACVLVDDGSSFGQSEKGRQTGPAATKTDDEGADDTQLTFSELKSIGAKRSQYRKFRPQIVGTERPKPKLIEFRTEIKPILEKACIQCHGADVEEGNIRIDQLDPNLVIGDDVDWWLEVVAVLTNGEMPPAEEVQLPDAERARVIEWISSEVQVASAVRRDQESHSSFRRMTRYEFNYSMQDLLGSTIEFGKDLPPESVSEDGFQNSSEMLQMSVVQFGGYRDAIQHALRNAIIDGDRPRPMYWGISMTDASSLHWEKFEEQVRKIKRQYKDDPDRLKIELKRHANRSRTKHAQAYFKDIESGVTTRATWSYGGARYALKPADTAPAIPSVAKHVAILPARQKLILELGNKIPDVGSIRVRVRASRLDSSGERSGERIPSLQLEFGWQASNDSQASVRISPTDIPIDAAFGKPAFYEWVIPLSEIYPRNSVRKTSPMGQTPSPSEYIKLVNSSVSKRDLLVDYVEVTAPFYAQWPPESHERIFGDLQSQSNETLAAQKVLERFMRTAWRRDVSAEEVEQKLRLFSQIRPKCDDFDEAMIEVLATVLSSPKFLYLVRATGGAEDSEKISQFELATRLSMFLWCSTPDQHLLDLASENRLDENEVLAAEVKRMLADRRAMRFSRQFSRQWLGMQLLDYLSVDKKLYRQFDPALKEAMQKEPVEFFHELLQKNESVLEFLHSDFTLANERLALHYGISDVYGNHFRRVKIEPHHRRGGVLTHAGLLAMNSDGKDSHPLKRGIWLLEKLLNDPPPPAVPEIDLADPAIAKLSLKEQIENHRNHAACMSCHAKIDPWGIAFENFDAVGAWRTSVNGKRVDASSKLFNQQKLDGMDGLKRFLLLNRQDQFVRAMVYKLTTFGLGRPLAFGDRSKIDEMTAKLRNEGDGLATLVAIIVKSDLFRSR